MNKQATDISVVIVSYKCLPVLRLMLSSVHNASEGLSVDVYVVDNDSKDGTTDYLKKNYDWVETIDAGDNIGFSKANNIALERCRGRVILVLNPDTIIPRGFLKNVVEHFNANPDGGAIGVHMINGGGCYLMESKRGYPDVWTSFFKLSGLWHIAPRSSFFNNYYVGQLERDEIGEAPILSGACMAFTSKLMSEVGVFDPMFFMYGEDIDLSWRMNSSSLGNIYRGDLKIIHFKGMSTPSNMKYIYHFYDAMLLFFSKHERWKHHFFLNSFVALGIWVGLVFAAIRCIANRCVNKFKSNHDIKKVLYVGSTSDADIFEKRVGIKTLHADLTKNISGDAMVFDVDNVDIDKMIDYMRTNALKYLYGFYSSKARICVVFDSDKYKILWDGSI